ncbi:MAG: DsbA family oxidoreductase [Betaproteobacteria bacterium]|nr:DsbA family oxidoreductase [Betaproteobacteria bacterium]
MTERTLRIDFVSDVACPWCAIGLHALAEAARRVAPEITLNWHFQPFELNPDMPPEGADTVAYLSAKYGIGEVQIRVNQQRIRERGAAVGFTFGERGRVWNTFDAHRLLAWAAEEGRQRELKEALLQAYHGEGRNPGARDVLLDLAARVGLNTARAAQVLDGDDYAAEVRAAEKQWQQAGIHAVPAVVVEGRHLIEGAQTPEVFERVLRQVAAGAG